MSKTVTLIIILFGILATLEVGNIIYSHKEYLKYKKDRILNKFKRKKNKVVQFD